MMYAFPPAFSVPAKGRHGGHLPAVYWIRGGPCPLELPRCSAVLLFPSWVCLQFEVACDVQPTIFAIQLTILAEISMR